ncbi:peptidase S8 and S53 subtilisin kexin sedolisin (plasmid) [Deinococcus psychrotolerans]|uniref:Peptidase S8 and S53 subtilisin kexin sedolisin n=1 Tax=Deinococcus psychrotolerans TaxID=2489213 RepID=A0A3G8YHJ4_9DEIO|nr:S8 family serine peptidase [Deinococcus psychrotolerans]AZI44742.1 peptidase S8 and S53 subtilisin kexin sedolisin [Deinococcus psychrotolerans]
MKRASLCLAAALASVCFSSASAGQLSPELLAKLSAHENKPVSVIVRFRFDKNDQGRALFKTLRQQLKQSRAQLGKASGFVDSSMQNGGTELWLYQSIALKLTPLQALTLSSLPIVDEVFENFKVKIPKVQALDTGSLGEAGDTNPDFDPLHMIGADATRAAGLRGQGIRIGHLDTGVDIFHPELQGKVVAFAEFNAVGKRVDSKPHDSAQHGTHTAGLLVGNTLGAAPDAKLISALVLPGGEGTFAEVIAGMQWVLDPDNNADTDDGANVVSLSLGVPSSQDQQAFVLPVQNMLRAGVVPVFAIGNYGPDPQTTASPGNIPDVIGVGAVDQSGSVAPFSSRGPAIWTGAYSGSFIKPDVVAPGVGIRSSFPGKGYGVLSGTSQAAPLVAGAVAVMLGAKPGSNVDDIKQALYSSSSNNGQKNNDSGYGLINLPAALVKLGVSVAAPPKAQAPVAGPNGYTFCVPEGQRCSFSGQKQVAFGAAGRYLSGLTSDGFNCTVAEWGSDPVPGTAKACFVQEAKP